MEITVLGATGSIGLQTLEVCRKQGYHPKVLTANSNAKLLAVLASRFAAETICIANPLKYPELKERMRGTEVAVLTGEEGLAAAARIKTDCVVNAAVGIAGLVPTLEAVSAGNNVALANKESMVAAGELINKLAEKTGAKIIPVDSEHSAIFQCLQAAAGNRPAKIILTCSGGAFYGKKKGYLEGVRPSDTLKNPNWEMGKKVTLDSATLMNKGLEFIEAVRFFDITPDKIEVVIHRESVIHSAVEFEDGAVIAQLSNPDMRIPIQYALTYPKRLPSPAKMFSFTDYPKLTFAQPDLDTFDCLSACIEAAKRGGAYPAVVNSANETAVELFFKEKINFIQIGEIVKASLNFFGRLPADTLEDIMSAHNKTRETILKRYIDLA
ncbi:MAG: 1-deoxy-D-xylulose-5-phosphate reductoisomerase [Ruminococcus sp.]|nr:1-deoxy-D-xylulose-5-phosphate reductoisomerase [Ruminococcus sp.]